MNTLNWVNNESNGIPVTIGDKFECCISIWSKVDKPGYDSTWNIFNRALNDMVYKWMQSWGKSSTYVDGSLENCAPTSQNFEHCLDDYKGFNTPINHWCIKGQENNLKNLSEIRFQSTLILTEEAGLSNKSMNYP